MLEKDERREGFNWPLLLFLILIVALGFFFGNFFHEPVPAIRPSVSEEKVVE